MIEVLKMASVVLLLIPPIGFLYMLEYFENKLINAVLIALAYVAWMVGWAVWAWTVFGAPGQA